MKTLNLFTVAILILSSCNKQSEVSQCPSQLMSSDENNCICKYLSKKNIREQKLKSKNGLIFMKPKIKHY